MQETLVVDDDRQYLELIKQILECDGLDACCVASGEEALQELKRRTFALMITDLNMPGLNGLELARKVQAIAPHMPIILSSGDISPEITRQATEIGISKVLAKPFHPYRMLHTIRRLIGIERKNDLLIEGV